MQGKVLNGQVENGDVVVSILLSEYTCLVGNVINITKAGSKEQEQSTGNETDDIWVDFTAFDYSENRIKEIEQEFKDLYMDPNKTFEELPLDMVAMSGDELLKIPAEKINDEFIGIICDSLENAAAWCMDEIHQIKKEVQN